MSVGVPAVPLATPPASVTSPVASPVIVAGSLTGLTLTVEASVDRRVLSSARPSEPESTTWVIVITRSASVGLSLSVAIGDRVDDRRQRGRGKGGAGEAHRRDVGGDARR